MGKKEMCFELLGFFNERGPWLISTSSLLELELDAGKMP